MKKLNKWFENLLKVCAEYIEKQSVVSFALVIVGVLVLLFIYVVSWIALFYGGYIEKLLAAFIILYLYPRIFNEYSR